METRRSFLRTAGGAALMAAAADPIGALGAFADCPPVTLTDSTLARFRASLAGQSILAGEPSYDAARLLFNRRFESHPLVIVRAADEIDVARTIAFARENGLRLVPRSGGHSYIGASGCGGIVLDVSALDAVAPLGGAMFAIGAGTKLVRVYGELACNGGWTVPSGSCESVGFAGIALGGGFGYRQRSLGLTCDRVRAIRVVRADGTAVTASPESEPDLFWAMRGGGGGSFGIATGFEIEAAPLETVHVVGWRWPASSADDALARMHALLGDGAVAPDTLPAVIFNINTATASPACLGILFSTGTTAEIAAMRELLVGRGGVRALPGSDFAYDLASPACSPIEPRGSTLNKAKSSIVYAPPAADTGARIVEAMAARIADPAFALNEYASVNFLGLGGAVGELAPEATAFPHRAALSEVQYLGYWSAPSAAKERANLAWIRDMYAEVAPRLSLGGAGCYINYADDDLAEHEWPTLYHGANYPRLQRVKQSVDPDDFFRGLQSVRLPG